MIKQPDLCKTWFETPQIVFFLYSRTCINKHYVLQLSSKYVFIIFNENGNQQHLKCLFHSCFFLYNFFQTFLQYMYLFSAVIGLKVSSQFHFLPLSLCSDYGMTKYRKERSFRERKISHERKVLFQLFGSNYLFLLIQNTIFDMIIIYSMLLLCLK